MSPELPHPDHFHLDAAVGWLGLRNPAEALAELDRLRPSLAEHPAVLAVRFAALAECRRHAEALAVADRHTAAYPDDSQGWINRANACFWLDRAEDAHACAAAVVDRFATEWSLPYNLACYALKLGRPGEARRWLAEALRRGEKPRVLAAALSDPDLAPLHGELRERQAA